MMLLHLAALLLVPASLISLQDDLEHFEAKVRPVLLEECSGCHGEKRQRSGLRLDRPADLLLGGDRGPLLVAGDPDASRLIRAIRYDDPDLQMPPDGRLDERVIRELERWVAAGAKIPDTPPLSASTAGDAVDNGSSGTGDAASTTSETTSPSTDHWSFQPPRRPLLPPNERSDWPRDPVDDFILARLEAADLEPAADADARTWLRRVSFDLIGLPPTRDDIVAFLDDDSPRARARVVDRLLASPHFGERWGRHWLDVVAYAESRGHEFDYPIPHAWQYRDWVVRALNADLPYDRFVVEQLAGDLVNPSRRHPTEGFNESVLGTGVWRLGEAVHSPVDIRGDEAERLAAKVDVLGKAFLGLTVTCARCHDHKFDPITARDYYALSGYFLSTSDRQVRFETADHNGQVARELGELRRGNEDRLRAWLAKRLEPAAAAAPDMMAAAAEVLRRHEARQRDDILFEDFESEDWDWIPEGEAFGSGPLHVEQLAPYQGNVGARGQGLVNSHNVVIGGRIEHSDHRIGTLTSRAFPIERRFVHLLIGGGNHEGRTGVQLLVGDEVVAELTGPANNRMGPATIDAEAWQRQQGRLRIVDTWTEGWGNIGVDHIVFSDRSAAAVFDTGELAMPQSALEPDVRVVAGERHVAQDHLGLWARALLEAARDPEDVLHPYAHLATLPSEASPHDERRRLEKHWRYREQDAVLAFDTVRWIARADRPGDWILDGPTFQRRAASALRWGTSAERPVLGLLGRAAIEKDAVWDVLKPREPFETDPSQITWIQAGRLARTRTFQIESGRLFLRVRGSGHVVAVVSSHRMLNGPLHHAVRRSWEGSADRAQWIELNLTDYGGLRAHLEISPRGPDESGSAPPLSILAVVESTERPTEPEAATALLFDALPGGAKKANLEELAAAYREVWSQAIQKLATNRLAASARGPDETRWLARLWSLAGDEPLTDPELLAVFNEQQRLIDRIEPLSRLAPALLDGNGVDEHFLPRGSHRSPKDAVPRRDLSALGGLEAPAAPPDTSGRLALAERWVDPGHPLVARVFVNRVWHHLFGRGIASVDNFGVLGEPPTHPELLDHLATRFVTDDWSLKRLIRALVLSRTYGLSSEASPEARRRDPANRLWQRMPVKRLEGEAIRDTLLVLSGRLDRTIGGPSVPVHLTPFMEGRGRPESGPLDGSGRRSLYLSVKRNFLSPFFLAFDYPIPMTTVGSRSVSNVPAQALTLLNDPFVHQQARHWAERMLAQEEDAEAQLRGMFESAVGRLPETAELGKLRSYLERRRAAGCDAATAWADLAHVLINLKELAFVR